MTAAPAKMSRAPMAMKWCVAIDEEHDFYLTVNGNRCVGESGKFNIITSCAAGNNKDEIWFKLRGERNGKRLNRKNFDSESADEKLSNTPTNGDFLKAMESLGVPVIKKKNKQAQEGNRTRLLNVADPDATPVATATEIPQDLEILKEKCAGNFKVDVTSLIEPPPAMKLRELDQTWVVKIKQEIKRSPGCPVTRIPVMVDQEIEIQDFQVLDQQFVILGGNHMITAIKEILREELNNSSFDCLRTIDVEVYAKLTVTEALFVSSWHNTRCQQKPLTFQEKVKVARKAFERMGGQGDWKQEAVVTLGYLENKTYTKEGLGTVLSVASYGEESWNAVESIFTGFHSHLDSYPQNLFKKLQGVPDEHKLPYLTKAIGGNGIKIAKMVIEDKRRENMKQMAVTILQEDSWEDVETVYFHSDKMLDFSGDLSTPEGRARYATYLKKTADEDFEKENEPNFSVTLKIIRNEKDVSDNYKATIEKYKKRLITEVKRMKDTEE